MPPAYDVEIEMQLLRLHQHQQPVHCFAADLRPLAVQLRYDDAMLRTLFIEGLKSYIQNAMVGTGFCLSG